MTVACAMREIENKYFIDTEAFSQFLLDNPDICIKDEDLVQHYIAKSDGNTVRLRMSKIGESISYVLCVKGQGDGVNEIENKVSEVFALPVLAGDFNTPSISKRRMTFELKVGVHDLKLEMDIYNDKLDGLIIGEVEVPTDDFFVSLSELPSFIARVMTDEESKDLSNYNLAKMNSIQSEILIKDVLSVFN
jgi:CYTH domain-containing protein